MPLIVTARDLRSRAAEVLRAVQEGETVTLTYRGNAVAEIQPLGPRRRPHTTDDAFGMWHDREDLEEVREWVREGRRRRAVRSSSIRTS